MLKKFAAVALFVVAIVAAGCGGPAAQSISGVKVATVGKVETNEQGQTVEQQNIIERTKRDNQLGKVGHLYIISPHSGQVILYSTVKGKPTSGGKRLTPRTIASLAGESTTASLPTVHIGGRNYTTTELPNEDGTYGSSSDYLYWFTPDGAYHQHLMNGSDIIHISDRPLAVKDVVIRVESGPAK